jgi:outer membrane protein assembly factor BamB
MGWMSLCHRRRYGRLEVASQIQLSDSKRHNSDGGGLVFFGDVGGNFYALNAVNGQRLWGRKIGGGVITYTANGAQKIAVATGFTSILLPTEVVTGKVVILGLGGGDATPPSPTAPRPTAPTN